MEPPKYKPSSRWEVLNFLSAQSSKVPKDSETNKQACGLESFHSKIFSGKSQVETLNTKLQGLTATNGRHE